MSDWFYNLVYGIGSPAFIISGSPLILHRDRARRKGAYILAATHFSPYDVALLIRETPRILDFVSITEVFQNRLSAWFLSSMGAFPLDRHKRDHPTVRTILDRLSHGRVVALFPEGSIRTPETSVLAGGPLKPGVCRLAQMANVPIIPCVVLGSKAYHKIQSWLPLRRTWYGLIYGEPMMPDSLPDDLSVFQEQLGETFRSLYAELMSVKEMKSAKGEAAQGNALGQ